jgi:hypothetical protein
MDKRLPCSNPEYGNKHKIGYIFQLNEFYRALASPPRDEPQRKWDQKGA